MSDKPVNSSDDSDKMAVKKSPSVPPTSVAGTLTPQEILDGFRRLREQQQFFASKIAELETERNEHKLVIETLSGLSGDRRCFRLMGGVLVERTVKEVLPALKDNVEKIAEVLETYNANLVKSGKELNEYREKHKIRFMHEEESKSKETPSQDKKKIESKSDTPSSGVLVG